MSIDTIRTHNFSCLPASIRSASPSLRSGLKAVVFVVAHLQRDLKLHLQHPGEASHRSVIRRPRRGQSSGQTRVSLISGHAQEYSGSYALLAIAREPFELCPHFKSPSPVSARELSIRLTWGASGPKPEFPAPEIWTSESRCAQGERVMTTGIRPYARCQGHGRTVVRYLPR